MLHHRRVRAFDQQGQRATGAFAGGEADAFGAGDVGVAFADDLAPGDALTEKNLRIIRPGLGLPPKYSETLLGKRVGRAVRKGTPMSWDLLTSAEDVAPAERQGSARTARA